MNPPSRLGTERTGAEMQGNQNSGGAAVPDARAFALSAIAQLAACEDTAPGEDKLIYSLARHSLHLSSLLEAKLNAQQAGRVLRKYRLVDPSPCRSLLAAAIETDSPDVLLRTLQYIEEVGPCDEGTLAAVRDVLGASSDVRIQSKAVLLIGKLHGNPDWAFHWARGRMQSTDSRIRANAVECIWRLKGEKVRAFFQEASRDSNWRVKANALIGLSFLGDESAREELFIMIEHESEHFRAAAAFAIGMILDPSFLPQLTRCMGDESPSVRRNAFKAMQKLRCKPA